MDNVQNHDSYTNVASLNLYILPNPQQFLYKFATRRVFGLSTIFNVSFVDKSNSFLGFDVLTAVVMNTIIFCDITPCILLKVHSRF
jgi:hypothetical protein